jgi:hypothetical protein
VTGSGAAGSARGACDAGVDRPGGVDLPVVTPWITITTEKIVLVKKPYTNPGRRQVTLGVDDFSFDGSGTFTFTGNAIRFFTQPAGGREVPSGDAWTGQELAMGVHLYAEGARPSASMRDVELVLTLTPGSKRVNPPARDRMTSVEVTLDIHKSRTAAATDPVALTVAQKTSNPGRIVHVQDTSFHHGRALMIIRKALPNDFTGDLVLTTESAAVRVFDTPHEIAAGQAALPPPPYTIGNGTIATPAGKRLWAEGANVSGAVGDTGFRLGVNGVDTDGDRVKMTVVQFHDLRAVVVPTPPAHVQGGNAAADHAAFGGGFAAANYDEDFAVNAPLVLIENSLPAARSVNLSVGVRPRVPVFWGVERNKFGANADHADIQALTGDPTVAPLRTDSLTATLKLDAVGSFRIRPFVDIDGAGNNEFHDATGNRIDREPYIIMNLILVRAQGYTNSSRNVAPAPAIVTASGGAGPITAATGVGVTTSSLPPGTPASSWTGPTSVGWNNARITLIGGGPQGRWGLDSAATVPQRVFAGWSQCIEAGNIFADYIDATVAPPVHHVERYIFALNSPTTLAPFRIGLFRAAGSVAPGGGRPSTTDAPSLATLPVLDVSPFPDPGTGGNTCVGTETAVGPPVPAGVATTNLQAGIVTVDLPLPGGGHALAYGQDWTVEQWDAPGLGAAAAPIMFAGSLVEFRFDLDFRTDLVVWTNVTGVPEPTNDAANRLYASVQTDRWTIRFRIAFDPPGSPTAGASHVATPLAFTMAPDGNPTRVATAVEGSGEEVRFPTALKCYAIDART